MLVPGLLFLVSAAALGAAGWWLVSAADIIAERTGLGRAFLGMILVATVTSLPELSAGVSAVTLAQSPDIAVGAIIGSCVFNLLLFAFADAVSRGAAFYGRLRSSHNLTAALGVILLGLLALSVLAPETARISVGHVGVYSLLLAGVYLVGARLLYAVDVSLTPDAERSPAAPAISMRMALLRCGFASVVVIVAGAVVAVSGGELATKLNLTDSLVGVLLVAAATSLPELVTVWAAVRLKAHDLAAGNLLGSNLFNMLLLVVYDVAYLDGPLLGAASELLAAPAVIAIIMTAVIIAALNYVRRAVPGPVDFWAGISLISLYLLNALLLFQAR